MALTVAYGVAAAAAVGSYAEQKKANKQAKQAADNAAIAAAAETAGDLQAATQAQRREKLAAERAAAEKLAAEQLTQNAEVTVGDDNAANRRRRVQAAFNVGEGGASAAGSIRV